MKYKQQWIDTIINQTKDEDLSSDGDLYNESPEIDYHSILPDKIYLKGEFKFWQLVLIAKHMRNMIKEKNKE